MSTCAGTVGDGVIRGVLGAVDCQTRTFAEAGYSALTSSSSGFQLALTALLTIYVALVGYRMMFASDGARLSDAPGIALKIGAILAMVTSWSTFQTLVFDTAAHAPLQIASIVSAPLASGSSALAADPYNGLQTAYDQLTRSAVAFGKVAGPVAKAYASPEAATAEALSAASGVLFMTSAGIVAAATLSIGVLTAIGPIFIAMFLIPATRGLFDGWVRALAASALVLLVAWLGVTILLAVLEPYLSALAQQQQSGRLDTQTANSTAALVFVFGAAQASLAVGACVMAFGFSMPERKREASANAGAAASVDPGVALSDTSRAQRLAFDLQRDSAQPATRERAPLLAAATASSASASRRMADYNPPPRLGDDYRRPAAATRRAKVRR